MKVGIAMILIENVKCAFNYLMETDFFFLHVSDYKSLCLSLKPFNTKTENRLQFNDTKLTFQSLHYQILFAFLFSKMFFSNSEFAGALTLRMTYFLFHKCAAEIIEKK